MYLYLKKSEKKNSKKQKILLSIFQISKNSKEFRNIFSLVYTPVRSTSKRSLSNEDGHMVHSNKVFFNLCKQFPALSERMPMKFWKIHHNSGNIHFQRVPKFVTPPPWVEVSQMRTKPESFLFWGLCLPNSENAIKTQYLSGFCTFLDDVKW